MPLTPAAWPTALAPRSEPPRADPTPANDPSTDRQRLADARRANGAPAPVEPFVIEGELLARSGDPPDTAIQTYLALRAAGDPGRRPPLFVDVYA